VKKVNDDKYFDMEGVYALAQALLNYRALPPFQNTCHSNFSK
jgi:hypothetical protein